MVSRGTSQSWMKDPFASPPLPRAFYHPSRSRDVDSKIAITGAERDNVQNNSEADLRFLNDGAKLISTALPHLNTLQSENQNGSPILHNVSDRSVDHYHEVWSESEHPSAIILDNSAQADISPFTSVSAENENLIERDHSRIKYDKSKLSFLEGPATNQNQAKTVLQKYIDRFRHSEPKSRTERSNDNATSYRDFWWMNSSPSSPADAASQANIKQSSRMSSSALKISQAEAPYKQRLTKEAVMEFDQETSKLQNKADQILSRSQLSLASSGPIVSTQGLGSSTSLSEYSLRSDSQVPYRPAFVNIREYSMSEAEESLVKTNIKPQQVAREFSSPPGDILAKWRMRRKMENTKSSSSVGNVKPLSLQRVVRNKEMKLRLEEFRKKLFSQRAMVTQEEIQYERQKMNIMLLEEETGKTSVTEAKNLVAQEEKGQFFEHHGADPILMRLKNITSSSELKKPTFSGLSNVHGEDFNQSRGNLPKDAKENSEEIAHSVQVNSNLNNAYSKSEIDCTNLTSLDSVHAALNENNTAYFQENDDTVNKNKNPVIDQLESIVLCDAKKKYVSVNGNTNAKEDVCVRCQSKVKSNSSSVSNEDSTFDNVSIHIEGLHKEERSGNVKRVNDERISSKDKQVYHQYLVAEKPNIEMDSASEESLHVEEEDFLEKSGKNMKKTKSKKQEKRNGSVSGSEKNDNGELSISLESGDNCTASQHNSNSRSVFKCDSSEKRAKVSSNDEQEHSKDHHETKPYTNGKSLPIQKNNYRSPLSSSKGVKPVRHKQTAEIRESCSPDPPGHQKIKKAVVETVADHLFDASSLLSSVDSWASLFPQSPAPSKYVYDSDLPSPSPNQKNDFSIKRTSPLHSSSITITDNEAASSESDNEFEDDPLLTLLRQQKQDYIRKLEAIESVLLKMDR